MTSCLASVSCKIPGISRDKRQHTAFPTENVLFISHKHEISTVDHRDLSLSTNTQHRANLVQIARRLATRATGSYAQKHSSCVERASWLLRMPFRLEGNYIFFRTSHFWSLSSSSGLPTSFRYHHLFTSTAANHGSTIISASWAWNRIEQKEGRFFQYTNHWDPTTTQTPLSSPRLCKCSHWKHDTGRRVVNCLSDWKQQESEAARDRMWA